MTHFKKKILIVDDQLINRMLLKKILSEKYEVFEASGGEKALEITKENKEVIQVILLDLVMPGMDGYTFLEIVKADPELRNIPIIVTTQSEGVEAEIRALELGASDYITKPYNNIVILQRVTNIIAFRENAILRNTAERDPLTGLYNKMTFYTKVSELLDSNPTTEFAILYMDIERFKIINDFFGEKEGDNVLIYIGKLLSEYSDFKETICCRFSADIFVICMPHNKVRIHEYVHTLIPFINKYPLNFRISVNFGIYVIEDREVPVNVMCDRASLALENVIGKYDTYFAYYDDNHLAKLKEEQAIANDMTQALAEKQFHVYLQPKFDMADFSIVGAEALVRWIHPEKGFIGPDKFIPIFERNGFITELDIYIWETTCKFLRKWSDLNWPIVPVSVNVSRVDIYRPDICDILTNMMEKYKLSTNLLELEITETAYTQNADQLISTVENLKKRGFSLSMDDFGSGYSSLNMLNEVPVDVLKIDMKLLRNLDLMNKSNNIINFVVSMAKWLNLPVISEGVETIEQVNFLRSIGCHTGQGYFFSKPLPIEQFEDLLLNHKKEEIAQEEDYSTGVSVEDIWDPNSQFNSFFDSFIGSYILFEYSQKELRFLRANEQFYQKVMPNIKENGVDLTEYLQLIHQDDRTHVEEAIHYACSTKEEVRMDFRVIVPIYNEERWQDMSIKVLYSSKSENLLLASIDDISINKNIENKYIKSAERLYEVLKDNSICLFDVDFKNKTLISDSLAQNNFGFADLITDPIHYFLNSDFIFNLDEKKVEEFFSALFAGVEGQELIFDCINKDQEYKALELKYKIKPGLYGTHFTGYCELKEI